MLRNWKILDLSITLRQTCDDTATLINGEYNYNKVTETLLNVDIV